MSTTGLPSLTTVPPSMPAGRSSGVTPPTRRGGAGRALSDVLVDLGFVKPPIMAEAFRRAEAAGSSVEGVLLAAKLLDEQQLSRALAERFGLDHLNLRALRVDRDAVHLLSPAAVRRYRALPVQYVNDHTVLVAMVDPANVLAVDDIAVMTGLEVRPAVASMSDVEMVLARLDDPALYEHVGLGAVETEAGGDQDRTAHAEDGNYNAQVDTGHLRVSASDDKSVIALVHRVISGAAERGASDIHFEPGEHDLRIRYRVDGVLHEALVVPKEATAAVVSRIKILSELDIAERRLPQDGRISIDLEGRHLDLRTVTLPAQFGENVVMRILDQSSVMIELSELGMLPQAHERFTTAFSQSHGAVLVTGPTGSGKSTSLYGALNQLNHIGTNIITIEDPVEYQLEGLTQVQVNPKAGLTFANGLRAMMRADPDIIMVGEIRDRETAQIAIEAALTGHLVLSTLHTNDAATAVTRLVEMGVEPFLVGSAVDCVVAQRLARKLCEECRRRTRMGGEVLLANGFVMPEGLDCYEPAGCVHCGGTGYRGRIGLYEVMTMSETIRSMAVSRSTADAIGEQAVAEGMLRLREDGLEKVRRGMTSIAEVTRVAGTK